MIENEPQLVGLRWIEVEELVELTGIEPVASSLRTTRSPS
jgi:hypothetical protein